jgi:hypothetical protein
MTEQKGRRLSIPAPLARLPDDAAVRVGEAQTHTGDHTMQYMLLIYEAESAYEGPAGEAARKDIVTRHMALAGELRAKGVMQAGSGLQSITTATTVLTDGGKQTVHDGPFAETREHLGGYYLVDVPDLDAALAIAKRIPAVDGGKVEVRPLIQR